jgi:hypothetical protein
LDRKSKGAQIRMPEGLIVELQGLQLITRRSLVRIQPPLLFPKRPEMVVFGLMMRSSSILCFLILSSEVHRGVLFNQWYCFALTKIVDLI